MRTLNSNEVSPNLCKKISVMKLKNNLYFYLLIFIFLTLCSFSILDSPSSNGSWFVYKTKPYILETPKDFPTIKIPDDNHLTVEGVALGRKLFYEPMLSANNKIFCGTCHQQKFAFSDSTGTFSIGVDGIPGKRNAMAIFNMACINSNFFWDGRTKDLESQVIEPIQNPIEMHQSLPDVIVKLQKTKDYPRLFKRAFGSRKITVKMLQYAIAQFERTIISSNSRYDKYVRHEEGGYLTPEEFDGLNIFNSKSKGNCSFCHKFNENFADQAFHNIGLDSFSQDEGRYAVNKLKYDFGKFRTPTLRNVELTGPYMHDGRFKNLNQVLDHYNGGFKNSPTIDKKIFKLRKGNMTQSDKEKIILFLKTLTDYDLISNPKYSNPNTTIVLHK